MANNQENENRKLRTQLKIVGNIMTAKVKKTPFIVVKYKTKLVSTIQTFMYTIVFK